MPLEPVTEMSDDDKAKPLPKAKVFPRPKVRASPEDAIPAKPKASAAKESKVKPEPNVPKAKPVPKEKSKGPNVLKRPAAKSADDVVASSKLAKKPAMAIKASKYMYHKEKKWGLKCNGVEYATVQSLVFWDQAWMNQDEFKFVPNTLF